MFQTPVLSIAPIVIGMASEVSGVAHFRPAVCFEYSPAILALGERQASRLRSGSLCNTRTYCNGLQS